MYVQIKAKTRVVDAGMQLSILILHPLAIYATADTNSRRAACTGAI
jgi:hypothetical protein